MRARYIRFIPIEWHNHISMRVEIYGCPGVLYLQIIFSELYVSYNAEWGVMINLNWHVNVENNPMERLFAGLPAEKK